jgi:hypothetical protein
MEKNENYIRKGGGLMFIKTEHLKRPYCCKNGCRGCPIYYGNRLRLRKQIPALRGSDVFLSA